MTASTLRFYYKQNRLKQLRAFCFVARSESISRAAERLFLSQPSVSLQIQALEREMDIVLFERKGPKIKLTPEGKNLYEIASPLVEGIDTLSQTFAARFGNIETGELDIAAGESTILYILPDILRRFSGQYPCIQVRLHNVTGRSGLEMLRADHVDFAVGSMLDLPRDIAYHPVFSYDPALITPLDHPLAGKNDITLKEVSPFGLILPPRHLSTWRIVDLVFRQHGLSYTVALEAGGWEVIKKYVQIGLGVSIVTDICLTGQESLARSSLSRYFPCRTYGLVIRKGKFLSPQAKRFIEIMDPTFFESQDR